ncbi:MAG TPA: phytanoyl-CoA dioxygenase family protein [Polyangiaceae bacterium]|jgi:phytanoyl-CoA hydroxylase
MTLTGEQLARYRRDGYLVLEGFAPDGECDELRARADALVDAFDPRERRSVFTTDEQARRTDDYFLGSGDQVRFFYEPLALDAKGEPTVPKALAINKIGHALHDLDPLFDRFSRAPRVERLVASLGLESPRLLQSMYIFKQPRIGGEVRCHQDATFLHTDPTSAMVGLWFSLEDATEDNGCLWAVPGGHRAGLQSLFVRHDDDTTTTRTLGGETWSDGSLVPLPVKKGAVIVLDGLLPHLSKQNESSRSRHAYTLHLVSGHAGYPATNWLRRAAPARGF